MRISHSSSHRPEYNLQNRLDHKLRITVPCSGCAKRVAKPIRQAQSRQPNPKMLHGCYKNAAANPLVANTGLIHKHAPFPAPFRAFFVGAPNASCQLQIIGRQIRRTIGTSRVVARLAGRERSGPARKSTGSLITERSDSHELIRTRSGTGNAVHRLDSDRFGGRKKR